MENATDALKMAFAVIVFTMALTIAIIMFSQLNQVSKIVISSTDITQYYENKLFSNFFLGFIKNVWFWRIYIFSIY